MPSKKKTTDATTAVQPTNFYDISAELAEIEKAFILAGGEITPEQEEEWKAVVQAHLKKAGSLIAVIRRTELTRDGIKLEAKRLSDQVKVFDNTAKRLKSLVLSGMQLTQQTEIQTPRGRLAVEANGGRQSLVVKDDVLAATIAEKYRRTEIVHSIDTEALRADLESDDVARIQEAQQYAYLAERGVHLRIY